MQVTIPDGDVAQKADDVGLAFGWNSLEHATVPGLNDYRRGVVTRSLMAGGGAFWCSLPVRHRATPRWSTWHPESKHVVVFDASSLQLYLICWHVEHHYGRASCLSGGYTRLERIYQGFHILRCVSTRSWSVIIHIIFSCGILILHSFLFQYSIVCITWCW